MTDAEKAIENLKETLEFVANTSYEINRDRRCRAIELAIQALREKAERENPEPLTFEEVKRIKKPKPLYKVLLSDDIGEYIGKDNAWWDVCCGTTELSGIVYWRSGHTNKLSDYGKTWVCYDHEPKESGAATATNTNHIRRVSHD